ncbi:MAG: hypothetical protein WC830_13775 [Burkholderiales bacterium]|jgi:hypothetical protein
MQQGLALLVMVIVLILGSAFFLVKQLNSTALRLNSDAKSNNVLAQAKDALIGYAATNSNQPGALPCPDLNVPGSLNEGTATSPCTYAYQRIGRLPWKTLGLPDLRDASGERLWYVLSENFLNMPGSTVINSDTAGNLKLDGNSAPGTPVGGTALATSVVAIVFAPGVALSGQNRDPGNSANLTSVANYLDGANADVANDDTFQTALSSDTFNDVLLPITHANLFQVVENYVAKRLDDSSIGNVKPYINSYVAQWGAYPFAVPFSTPSSTQNAYQGAANTTYGLLPLTQDSTFLTWRIPSASEHLVTQTGNAGSAPGTVSSDCSSTSATVFRCSITYARSGWFGSFEPYISVTPRLRNVGMGFVDYDQISVPSSKIVITTSTGGNVSYGTSSSTYQKPAWSSNTLQTDGDADMSFINGRLRSTTSNRTVILKITWSGSTSQYLTRPSSPSTPNTDWFFDNEWYKFTYYSLSTGYAPGKGASCGGVSPACLTLKSIASDKHAILVLAGSANATQTRPSSNLSDYLEDENLTPADGIFESKTRSDSFNDKIVILAP